MIINFLTDNDLYKQTMLQVVLHNFSDFQVKYKFKCRTPNIIFTDTMLHRIIEEAFHFATLRMTEQELAYLKTIRFLKPSYIEFMKLYQPNIDHFSINLLKNGELDISIEGPWWSTIMWEVPLLSIINEVYMEETYGEKIRREDTILFEHNLDSKIIIARDNNFKFSEFGTRRRYSYFIQNLVNERLSKFNNVCTGTSNVHFAMKYGMSPIGTMAHEFIMAAQGCDDVTLANSQKYMLQKWVDEYRGDLGIALSDTLGIDKFLKDFDKYFSNLYEGVRHDSGDPFEWGEKMIKHYEKFKIDPKTKTLVFSDGLTFPIAAEIQKAFGDRAKVAFGIGTNLTNDFEGVKPLNIVIKLVQVNGKPCAKISDTPGKTMCEDQKFIEYLRSVI